MVTVHCLLDPPLTASLTPPPLADGHTQDDVLMSVVIVGCNAICDDQRVWLCLPPSIQLPIAGSSCQWQWPVCDVHSVPPSPAALAMAGLGSRSVCRAPAPCPLVSHSLPLLPSALTTHSSNVVMCTCRFWSWLKDFSTFWDSLGR